MARKFLIAGNWKMNKTPKEGKAFIEKMISDLDSLGDTNVIICPPFTGLTSLSKSNKYNLGAQIVILKIPVHIQEKFL